MGKRKYEGDPLDHTYQDISERPYKNSGETVGVFDGEGGRESTEGVNNALQQLSQNEKFDDIDSWIVEMREWDIEWRQELLTNEELPVLIRTCIFSSIMKDVMEHDITPDYDIWGRYATDFNTKMRRLLGLRPFHSRIYLGDKAMHNEYERYINEVLPELAPDPLQSGVES